MVRSGKAAYTPLQRYDDIAVLAGHRLCVRNTKIQESDEGSQEKCPATISYLVHGCLPVLSPLNLGASIIS